VMGQKSGDMASVAVTRAEHQVFTNAWRQAIPYWAEGHRDGNPGPSGGLGSSDLRQLSRHPESA
jgi:hypothetical protein